jgi:hypothetical protein
VRDVDRIDPRNRQQVHVDGSLGQVLPRRVLQVRAEPLVEPVRVDHRRVHVGGVDGVHADRLGAELRRERTHEAHEAVLGRHVVSDVCEGFQAGGRTREDDRAAAAARPDVRDGGLAGPPHPVQIDVHHVEPHVLGELLDRVHLRRDARVRAHDVEPSEPGDALVERRLESVVVAHVRLRGDDPPAQRLDLPGGLRQILLGGRTVRCARDPLEHVDRDDVRAFRRQTDRVRPALPARRSGDEGDLALDSSHGSSIGR